MFGRPDLRADQPVRRRGVLVELVLLDERAPHVRQRLVHRARLAPVLEAGLGLGHPVAELVADHVERARHHAEHLPVAVAEHHPLAVPEGVRVHVAEVDHAAERHAGVVDRVAAVRLEPELVRVAEPVVGLVGRHVARRRIALAADDRAANVLGVLGVADHARGVRLGDTDESVRPLTRPRHAGVRVLNAREPDRVVAAQSTRGPFTLLVASVPRDVLENDRRQYAVKAVTAGVHASLLAEMERVTATLRPPYERIHTRSGFARAPCSKPHHRSAGVRSSGVARPLAGASTHATSVQFPANPVRTMELSMPKHVHCKCTRAR